MKSFDTFYKNHIYGIIGTLVFHILVVGVFLIAEINQKSVIQENILEIEIPIELLEPGDDAQSSVIPGNESEMVPNDPLSGESKISAITNQPSNRGMSHERDPFFNEEYQKEVDAAQKLVSDVNRQLAKEIADINSIPMPEDVTEGKAEEEIKNIIYSGESNIEYHLGERYHLRLPIPVYLAKGGGTVTVDISVNRDGRVISAKARPNPSIRDQEIFLYSQVAAQRTLFNADPHAAAIQNGTIRYTFIAQ
mgnify:CR=1 FL=1